MDVILSHLVCGTLLATEHNSRIATESHLAIPYYLG